MIIKLVRHGESEHNAGEVNSSEVGDHNVGLTKNGIAQARCVGKRLGGEFVAKSLLYTSPYLRARQTLLNLIDEAEAYRFLDHTRVRIYQDPRLREMEWGILKTKSDIDREESLREQFGWFYYRLKGGESPADTFDRVSTFMDSLHRQLERKKKTRCIIVSHGITIRCFIMRWFHLTVDQYEKLRNPKNCDVITISDLYTTPDPQFVSGKWAVTGLRFRPEEESHEPANIGVDQT